MSDEEYEKLKQYMADQIKEIELYKWLESEKANRDLGEEAVKDWIEKHAAEFRERWEKEHKSRATLLQTCRLTIPIANKKAEANDLRYNSFRCLLSYPPVG